MAKNENYDIPKIKTIISDIFDVEVMHTDLIIEQLSGGTVANVTKLKTASLTTASQSIDFPLVIKTQKKWERLTIRIAGKGNMI